MEVRFATQTLENCYRDLAVARRAWGQKIANRYVQRVNALYVRAWYPVEEPRPG